MKKLFIFLFFLASAGIIYGQSAVDKVFNKYAGKDGYTTVVINSFMFKLLSNIETNDPEYESFKKASSGLESIRILTQDGEGSHRFARELLDILPRDEYEEMMTVKEVDEEVVFLAREVDNVITEFLLIVTGNDDEDVLIVFTGKIDLESIASIASGMNLPAMESLEEFGEE